MTKGERTRLLGSGRLCYVLVAVGSLDGLCLNCFGSIGLRDLPFMFEDQWIMLDPYFLFSIGTCHILHGRGPWQTSLTTSQVQPEAAPSTAFPSPLSSARHACRPAMGSLEMLHHGFATTCPVAAWSTGHPPCFAGSFLELPRISRGQKNTGPNLAYFNFTSHLASLKLHL